MTSRVTRRRALQLCASFGATLAFPCAAMSDVFTWKGTALGADATLLLADADQRRAEEAAAVCLAEVARLERIFSLFDPESEICRLNRDGRLDDASFEMQDLLGISRRLHRLTEALFDPTVQTLWRHLADRRSDDPTHDARAMQQALGCVGMDRLHLAGHGVRLEPGTALTLNGIAQGYITDKIAGLLRHRGWINVLIDLGEVVALDGKPFDVHVRESGLTIPLASAALATSCADSLSIGPGRGLSHVLDPRTGAPPRHWRAISVRHASAAWADGLSTALLLTSPDQGRRILDTIPGVKVWATSFGGTTVVL